MMSKENQAFLFQIWMAVPTHHIRVSDQPRLECESPVTLTLLNHGGKEVSLRLTSTIESTCSVCLPLTNVP